MARRRRLVLLALLVRAVAAAAPGSESFLLDRCPLPGYCFRARPAAGPAHAFTEPTDASVARWRQRVTAHLASPAFQARKAQLAALPDDRGVLFVGAGKKMLGAIAATVWMLRTVWNSSLPVEVAYVGAAGEMDPNAIAALDAALGGVTGLDLSAVPPPAHHNPEGVRVFRDARGGSSTKYSKKYEAKPYALLHTRFRRVLFLDYDCVPLANPEAMFDGPHMAIHGNAFFPDVPTLAPERHLPPAVFELLGLNRSAVWPVLADAHGPEPGLAESGQFFLDRVRHADVLEHLWLINSHAKAVYAKAYGDKDTFALAFAAAGKAHEYAQLPLRPGGVFNAAHKLTGGGGSDWFEHGALSRRELASPASSVLRLKGMVHFDHLGRPLFMHQTLNKNSDWLAGPPAHLDLVTGPLPTWVAAAWWKMPRSGGGGHPTYKMPLATLWPLAAINPLLPEPADADAGAGAGPCAVASFADVRHVQSLGISLLPQPVLETACEAQAVGGSSSLGSDSGDSGSSSGSGGGGGGGDSQAPDSSLAAALTRAVLESATARQPRWALLMPQARALSGELLPPAAGEAAPARPQERAQLAAWLAAAAKAAEREASQLLAWPNWGLQGRDAVPSGMPALRLMRRAASAGASAAAVSGGLWHAVDALQLDWLPRAVEWIGSEPALRRALRA